KQPVKLSPKFSAAVGGSFIYSNLASGFQVGGVDITAGTAFAADISMAYNSNPDLVGPGVNWSWGLAITNLGSKISYTNAENSQAEFIPTNLGIGAALTQNIDEYNTITFALDMNKLLVPTPFPVDHPEFSLDGDGVGDYRQKSTFAGVFGSFSDAPGGFSEELQELSFSLGAEYWYDRQFAVRAGYFYENPNKGDRQFLTIGVGLRYNVFGIDLSYLAPTNTQRSPLDNTLRFSFTFGLNDVRYDN
ncbi:MAG: type IX secretion system outer membrane channel protein PorV, partial [Bacteroidota bacterium]